MDQAFASAEFIPIYRNPRVWKKKGVQAKGAIPHSEWHGRGSQGLETKIEEFKLRRKRSMWGQSSINNGSTLHVASPIFSPVGGACLDA